MFSKRSGEGEECVSSRGWEEEASLRFICLRTGAGSISSQLKCWLHFNWLESRQSHRISDAVRKINQVVFGCKSGVMAAVK